MTKMGVDDPLEATQVHGFCGIWGCIATAFFHREKGIFYRSVQQVDLLRIAKKDPTIIYPGTFLGMQLLGVVAIIAWVGILSAIFFSIAKALSFLRLSKQDEILGGDLHYFAPITYAGAM